MSHLLWRSSSPQNGSCFAISSRIPRRVTARRWGTCFLGKMPMAHSWYTNVPSNTQMDTNGWCLLCFVFKHLLLKRISWVSKCWASLNHAKMKMMMMTMIMVSFVVIAWRKIRTSLDAHSHWEDEADGCRWMLSIVPTKWRVCLEHGIFDDISPQWMVFDLLERDDKLTQIGGFPQHLLDKPKSSWQVAEQSLDSLDGKITSQLKTICCRYFFGWPWFEFISLILGVSEREGTHIAIPKQNLPIKWKIWEFEIWREPCIGYSLKMSIFPPVAQEWDKMI